MINNADDAMPVRCQSCVPGLDCVFFLSDDDDSAYGYDDCCACSERARMIAMDVNDAGSILRQSRVNLNNRAAIKAVLLKKPFVDFVDRAIEDGRLDNFIKRAVKCAKAELDR
jgi:hypothetical protein